MNERQPSSDLMNPVFAERWSPRAFSDRHVDAEVLAALFEAARWTPSWFNNQPWYFVYCADDADHQAIADVFMERNRLWAAKAPVVGLVVARTELEGFMGRSRDFDTGAATMALTIQATMLGLSVHLMGGIEIEPAQQLVGVDPEVAKVVCGFALGYRGDAGSLPDDFAAREMPSDRKPVSEFAFPLSSLPEGMFAAHGADEADGDATDAA